MIQAAIDDDVATVRPDDVVQAIQDAMWEPVYEPSAGRMMAAPDKSSNGTKPRSGSASSAGHSPNGQQEKAPKVLDLPVGLDATGTRHETDSIGRIDVPADRYWGAQTQRSWCISRSATTGCLTPSTTPTGT